MPEGHYFHGLGKEVIRFPQEDEVNLVTAAGNVIHPQRYIRLYKRAIINGTEYRIQDNIRRKFCNHLVFCQQSRFFVIEKILSYRYGGQLIAGFIGRYLQNNQNIYRVPYMQRVTDRQESHFISYSAVISPAFIIPSIEETAVVSLCNVWETD